MIDYNKLKLAQELNSKLPSGYCITHHWDMNACGDYFRLYDRNGVKDFHDLDDLIAKLRELTQTKPKYEVGQIVAYIDEDNAPAEFIIEGICDFFSHAYSYWESKEDDIWHLESELYPSKEVLLGAMVDYWGNLYCQHVGETYDGINFMQPSFEGAIKGFNDIQINQDEVDLHRCQHECDGISGASFVDGIRYRSRCRKCGSFFDEITREEYFKLIHRHTWDGKFYDAVTKEPCDMKNTMLFVCKCADCGEWYR